MLRYKPFWNGGDRKKKVDWTQSAPATASGSLVDGACLRDAHPTNANIQWAERAKSEVLSTQVSPSQGRSRSEDLPLQIAIWESRPCMKVRKTQSLQNRYHGEPLSDKKLNPVTNNFMVRNMMPAVFVSTMSLEDDVV